MTSPSRRASPTALTSSFIGLALVLAVLVAGLAITAAPAWSAAETRVVAAVGAAHNPLLDALCQMIDAVFGPAGAPILGILLLAWALLLTGTWRGALRAGLLLVVPWMVAQGMKFVVRRPRPEHGALIRTIVPAPLTSSYPSGHTAFAAALVCAFVLSLATARARTAAAAVGGVVVLAVAWSRVYLGVHYPTDVVASIVLVLAIALPLDAVLTRMGPLRVDTPARVTA
ncbi:phosphatase PAP2 family protein [Microbacterium terrisoli]|uniref:phosphatase PAP2 family protein n=1 Tax=Microbacterium terrisoli TaxID=3242192 RepID=UPI0028039F8E|nr:phosphatase PAP2 family protein [Microbacterium protaetiae]